jgi:hypothetical protein
MSDDAITNEEVEALLRELDRGPSDRITAGPDGLRPRPGNGGSGVGGGTGDGAPTDGRIVLPRGVWGAVSGAIDWETLARSARGMIERLQRRAEVAEQHARESESELERERATRAELEQELVAARAQISLAGKPPVATPRTEWFQ